MDGKKRIVKPHNLHIYKYPLRRQGPSEITLTGDPNLIKIMALEVQDNRPVVYAAVDPNGEKVKVKFIGLLTGDKLPEKDLQNYAYIKTVMLDEGAYVVHWFQDLNP